MAKKDFLPIILGSDENAYGTARLFCEAYDVRPLLLCTVALSPARSSKMFDVEVFHDFELDEVFPDALLGVLRRCAAEYEKLLVIPCSDYYTALLCRYADRFEGLIANRFNPYNMLETFDTKDRFYALCAAHGLDYPKTAVCAPEERESVLDRLPFDFPIVVKPENSNATEYLRCHFEGQKKVFFFDTREQYLAMIANMNRSDYRGKLILQEFVPGGDGAMRVLNSYSDADGRVRAMCLGQPVLEYYDPKSVGNYAAILSRGDYALYEKIQTFLEEIGYVGFANIDMKFDRRTGRYLLFEINPRLGRSSYFVRSAGINMMKLLADDVVYGKRAKCVYNEAVALWSNVPRGILNRYVTDPALRKEIAGLKMDRTLKNPADFNLKRAYRIARVDLAQYKLYRQYYFDKEKER
ncbi:MAG: hypothetical protein E7474_14950 [Ruminococcaceae bacterium]|nr:hypothetical protein [Oscillospiraceae bacterium]